jgi:nitrogen fixation/metabolism regulation signal transduction histidine kinase
VRLRLSTKAVLGLLAIAGAPLVASVVLVRQVALVAQSVAVGEAERLHASLERARGAYLEALAARKQAFQHAGDEVAARPALRDACRAGAAPPALLQRELDHDPSLAAAALALPGRLVRVARPAVAPSLTLVVDRPLVEAPGCAVELTYETARGAALADDYQELGDSLRAHRHLEEIRRDLPPSYQLAFVLVVGAFALATTAVAIVYARRLTRRIDALVAATRRVAEGDLETRVAPQGGDELADLGRAFDDMTAELALRRRQIDYLSKIAAWQEVARRLAHEIKNPLTPIQLAVQELHDRYKGDDPRFRRMLDDARDIVAEEIGGLRRLVDSFSAFAKLPRVEPRPLDLAAVVDDVVRAEEPPLTLELAPPPAPAIVSGDRLLLRRALGNLVENARQAGARTVRIAWDERGLTVDDDGPGVPADLGERVFDPYVTTKPHGTGLGLAIVKKTVLEHGGTIVLARSPLGGARFAISLGAPSGPSPAASAS